MSLLPALAWINRGAAARFESLQPATQQKLRERVQWPIRVEKPSGRPSLDDRYVKGQVRRYYHSPEKLARQLGWRPPLSYEQGLDTVVSWLRFAGICEGGPG